MAVTGIGRLFFRAENPELPQKWCLEHLGVGATNTDNDWVWNQTVNPTVFAFRKINSGCSTSASAGVY